MQVFTNDEMPNTICDACRLLMDYCYRFKQMCKKADTVLKQFPLTGVWPTKFQHPKYPEEMVQVNFQSPKYIDQVFYTIFSILHLLRK